MQRILLSTGNIIVSLVLGAVAIAFVGINYPETLDQIINLATSAKSYIVSTNLPPKYNVWVRLLLEEKQLVFMFFTVVMRILLAILQSIAFGFFGRERTPEGPPTRSTNRWRSPPGRPTSWTSEQLRHVNG